MREQFENFPRIKPILRLVKYSESSDGYDPLDQKSIYEKYADWLNGAWYVFQEQQKQLDLIKKLAVGLRNEFNLWADDTEAFDAIEAQIENLEAVLK